MFDTGEILRKHHLALSLEFSVVQGNYAKSARKPERRFDGIRKPCSHVGFHCKPVYDNFYRVALVFVKLYAVVEASYFPVYPRPYKSVLSRIGIKLFVRSLFARNGGGKHIKLCAFGKIEYFIEYLVYRLFFYHSAAHGTVRSSGTRIQKP